jgi:hypothetical protein
LKTITTWKYFSVQYARYPKQLYFIGSEALSARPCDKSNVKIKKSTEHWWNDTDRVKPVQVLRFPTTDVTWNGPGSNPGVRGERPPETQHGLLNSKINLHYILRIKSVPHREGNAVIMVRIIPNTSMLCGQTGVIMVLNLAAHIVTTRLRGLR